MKEIKNKVGRPRKTETVTPGLRIEKAKWTKAQQKYPKQVNQMFNKWIDSIL